VTGFLGPNGAGKSTTMRLIVGLDRPSGGVATINGKRYDQLSTPLCVVGALLDAEAVHPGRTAFNHLLFLAQSQGLPRRRVDEVIDLVGLHDVARERAGGFSLGAKPAPATFGLNTVSIDREGPSPVIGLSTLSAHRT
jgi:ABC-2 type transport system ATP-binding protein